MKKRLIVGMCLVLCASGAQAMQKNGEVWYDTAGHAVNAHGGGVLAHGGKYYLYGEHKVYGRAGNKAHVGVHIYSSDDLEKWKDEGIALKVEDKPGHDIEDGCVLERPKILFCDKTGKFVMFFHLELKGQGYSAARVGIAVADKATGPYRFLRSLRPNAGQWPMNVPECERVEETKAKYMTAGKKAKLWGAHFDGGQMSRDMTLFKDDDGKAWHIFSSEDNSTLHIAELTDDYLDYTGRWWRAAELDWTEAAAVCKKDGWYYLIGSGCTGWKPNTARCYRAKSITGPWERLGNPCKGVNPANGLGPDLTWGGQSNYILTKDDGEYLAMFDIWKPDNQIDSRLVWLPIDFNADGTISIDWKVQTRMTTFGDDLYEAKSEFTMEPYSEEIFNTHLPSWRSQNVMIKIVQQYRANYPDSAVTDREIAETLAGSELKLVPRSRLVTIAVRSKSPELAATLANAYAEAIEVFTDEENMKRCDKAVAQIHQHVEKQRCVDDDLAARLLKFRRENRTDNLLAEREILKQSLRKATEDALEFEKRVTAASEWVKVLQAVQEKSENSGELPTEVPRSSELAAVYTKLQAVKMELTTLKTRFTSVHPAVVAKEGKLKEVAAEFADVAERAVSAARGNLEDCQKQLKDFRRKSEELKKKIKELGQKSVLADAGLKSLEAEKIISCKVYQDLLRKENEARIAAELNNVIIRVGRRAQIPSRRKGLLK